MTVLIAVFRSKTDVFAFLEALKKMGVFAQTTATPKEAKIGCGLAVKFSTGAYNVAEKLLKRGNYLSFYGIYLFSKSGDRTTTSRIL